MNVKKNLLEMVGVIFLMLSCLNAVNAGNKMPNPGAEKIVSSNEYPKELSDQRITMAEYIPAEGWGCYNSCGYHTWGVTDKEAHSGTYSTFLTVLEKNEKGMAVVELCLGGATDGNIGKYAIQSEPNTTYYFSLWLKGNVSQIYIKWLGWKTDEGFPESREFKTTSLVRPLVLTEEWKKYEGVFTTSKETKRFVMRIQIPNTAFPQPGQTIYVDDVEIVSFYEKVNK